MTKLRYRKDIFYAYKQLAANVSSMAAIAQNDMEITPEMIKELDGNSRAIAKKIMELKTEMVQDLEEQSKALALKAMELNTKIVNNLCDDITKKKQ